MKRVYVQGDAPFRASRKTFRWYVRTPTGAMAPFSAFASTRGRRRPQHGESLQRLSASIKVQGQAPPDGSSGDAMDGMEELRELPRDFLAWSGLSYQERQSSGQAPYLYAISLVVVFLCLAALYESWSIPCR